MEPRWIDVTFINLIVDNRLVTLCLPCVAFSPSRPHKSHRPCYSTRKQNCNSIRTRSPWLSGNSKDNPFSSRCGIYAIQMVAQAGSASAKDRYRINPLERQMSRIPFSPFSWVRGLILRNAILKVTLDWKGISRRPRPFCREGLGMGRGKWGRICAAVSSRLCTQLTRQVPRSRHRRNGHIHILVCRAPI